MSKTVQNNVKFVQLFYSFRYLFKYIFVKTWIMKYTPKFQNHKKSLKPEKSFKP